ncbi:sugar phosphate nucleotidyltransferase [Priestia taiwanensis]|uniref:Glucose-1-phosphate adenylyltransferase n=1 Tax=Priestia taiwanensis TaxID=1347902 RepID=A0A917AV30_9BACI|nr:sugar phosphate nucleotidyltransferase [Priestia taiwanensis]MBM7363316.1 glucose-1-phosphate adenylyltransferase [Priestia taiwanensis]GGE78158.1 glucose-1-phosphate adenylyltransferase [Priestia taiwanensis]
MNQQMLGIIDATAYEPSLDELIRHRSLAALPFGGRYRLIDFMLSNFVNSNIHSVAVFPCNPTRSLLDHVGSGKQWDLDRKRHGLFLFPPSGKEEEFASKEFFQRHMEYLLRSTQKYVVVANSHVVGTIDFRRVLQRHLEAGADITELCYEGELLGMYVIERELLLHLFCAYEHAPADTLITFIRTCQDNLRKHIYEVPGYLMKIDSLTGYYRHSMSLLRPEIWKQVFTKEYPIYTKAKDEPPTKYASDAKVQNAMIANGSIIEGNIDSSLLFRSVKVGKGTIIRNSIIMQKSQIGDNCILDGVIIDKDVKIEDGTIITGTKQYPYVIRKGTVQGALMKS